MLHERIDEARVAIAEETRHDELEQRLRIELVLRLGHAHAEVEQGSAQLLFRARDCLGEQLVEWLEYELYE